MLCDVCREGLEGIWDPNKSKRIGPLEDFPEILQLRFPDVDNDGYDKVLNESELKEPERYVFGHHVDYDSLVQSKQQGCVACKEFGEANDRDDVNTTFAERGYYSVFCIALSQPGFDRPTMLVYSGDMTEEFFHELVVHDENDHLNSTIPPSTSDAKTWAVVRTWLDRCIESHPLCKDQALPGFSPTRLLELGTMGAEKTFRLVHRGEFNPEERYVTLSHCWGPAPAEEKLRLVVSCMSTLRSGLPIHSLPRTFRHAFAITERLCVRYIWIDRLCIIQDCGHDWRIESATMQTIYRNGFLNIAALGAKDDEAGLFFDRDPAQVGPTIVNLNPSRELPSHYRHVDETQAWASDFNGEPLITRAWVLQERMLAARNLYFGRKQVFWECCTTDCSETIPAGPLLTYITRNTAGLDATKSGRFAWKRLINTASFSLRSDADLLSNLLHEWSGAVQTYCECSLTFSKDKLVALSGLANHMGAILRGLDPKYGAYLAGMWRLTMPDSLLWKVKGPSLRPSSYRAPSWSWASVDGSVTLPAGGRNSSCPLVRVLNAETFARDENAMGEISGGRVLLKGPMCIAKGLQPKKPSNPLHNVRKISTIHCLDTDLPIDAQLAADIQFDDSRDQYDEVYALAFWSVPYDAISKIVAEGLALIPVDESLSLYRRVGYAKLDVEMDEEDQDQDRYNPVLDACRIRTIEVV
ncbi:HET-domain-containing protein [Hypoxylon crocopeplum]|nr:HET-domain-containing protein [Hypoxylon crocopeplum]